MRRPAPSIRLRIAVVTALVAAVVLGSLAALLAARTAEVATTTATQLAAEDLRPFAVDLVHHPGEEPDPVSTGVLLLVVDPDGVVRRSSMPPALADAAEGVRGTGDVAVAGGRYRVVERTVQAGGPWRITAARDRSAGDALVAGVMTTLLVGTPLAVLATAAAAWSVAGAALRPVERMREAAERLRAPGSSGRLPMGAGRELAELGATLNGLVDDLRESAEHERRVTSDTAHELRTPLAVLGAQVERASRPGADPDLPAIRASVERVSRLADQLLLLARADRDEDAGSAPVAALVTEAMEAVDRARLLAPAGVEVDLSLEGEETGRVGIDPVAFGRVLANLTSNALAAGPASAVDVRLRCEPDDLVLVVADDGPGFPPDFLPFAFERFSRPERSRGSGAGGAGLGLALVERLAHRSGGDVHAENRVAGGAAVTVRLPKERGRPTS
ncbi:sensor histidine kinase [Amnibacterium endophyticum]|uniref:histidine kinase n=1 Tax=Amnibacterium endophyticum TaxID=2109337 RepID=A0ABW4LCP5_9MICO